jgi:hypothetical protein
VNCPQCKAEIESGDNYCLKCGAPLDPSLEGAGERDATGGIIPYKNPPALIAYYLAVFSLIPCLGLPLGLAAFVLGIVGLVKRKRQPHVKGSVHAWIGILLGGGMVLLWGTLPFWGPGLLGQ